jgi:8-oxo-dGTP pyrophosphatase MutT (NUDIX family)
MKDDQPVYQQSAAIPFRVEDGKPFILLITSNKRKRWIIPKGLVEDWQSAREAALEEAFEEAGVKGAIIGDSVGGYEYHKWGGICRVKVFLLRVEDELEEWPESDIRERKWVAIDEALRIIDNEDLLDVIQEASLSMK